MASLYTTLLQDMAKFIRRAMCWVAFALSNSIFVANGVENR